MAATIEFFFDFGSPTAYMAYTQLPSIAERTGASLVYRPVLLGGVFKATGNASPATVSAKGAYMGRDLARSAAKLGVDYAPNPHFPVNTLAIMRGAIAAQHEGEFQPYLNAMYRAMWTEERNMQEFEEIAAVLGTIGLDPARYGTLVQEQVIKDELKDNTEEAVSRGVFGAPTMFVGSEMFFGHDRLAWVEELAGAGDIPPTWTA